MAKQTYCGFVAIVGRPNVGKSTLLNTLLGSKLSITADKPQTTRHKILGIKTKDTIQTLYVDTPGIHEKRATRLNQFMNSVALSTLHDVDVIVFVVEAGRVHHEDEFIIEYLSRIEKPLLLAVNKIDELADQDALLPILEQWQHTLPFVAMVPISAVKNKNVDRLETLINQQLPESVFYYEADRRTDRDENFFISEIIREKLVRGLGQELPYATEVQVEKLEHKDNLIHIHALIWVERDGQKAIVIGKQGQKLKSIATAARVDLEKQLGQKVMLEVWVKVKAAWSNDASALKRFGYHND